MIPYMFVYCLFKTGNKTKGHVIVVNDTNSHFNNFNSQYADYFSTIHVADQIVKIKIVSGKCVCKGIYGISI